ncbi:hypothetical protein AB1Y20_002902 [Prymnesium parvum]|uniref:NodB homology domain-containing protein n=1 Tax=Prymnesium parvum TaxID=97485 RepID=A0AB34JA96_PRYPA
MWLALVGAVVLCAVLRKAVAGGAARAPPSGALTYVASQLTMGAQMLFWAILSEFSRLVARWLFLPASLCYYDVAAHPGVKGLVALTIDDAFCRGGEAESFIRQVQAALKAKQAKASFFCTLNFCREAWREREVAALLKDGHELCNHCVDDKPYDAASEVEFEQAFDATDAWIRKLNGGAACRWFRAPNGSLSAAMLQVLRRKGATSVLTDCYACDCHIPYPRFVAWAMCRRVTHGSILILHMPEKGFREWGLETLVLVLDGLQARGLRSVTLSELAAAAEPQSSVAPVAPVVRKRRLSKSPAKR